MENMDATNDELKMIQEIGSSLVACVKEKHRTNERDEDALFGELIASQLRKIGSPEKIMIKMKISQLIYDHQMRASTAVRGNWERSNSPVGPTLQSAQTVKGGNRLSGSLNATTDFLHSEDSFSSTVSAPGVFRSSSPDLDKQRGIFPPGHFFQQQPSYLQELNK